MCANESTDGERTHRSMNAPMVCVRQHATRFVARCVAGRSIAASKRSFACRTLLRAADFPTIRAARSVPCRGGSPRTIKHVLRFTGDELTFRFDGLVEHFPQARKCFGLRVGAQYGRLRRARGPYCLPNSSTYSASTPNGRSDGSTKSAESSRSSDIRLSSTAIVGGRIRRIGHPCQPDVSCAKSTT